MASENFSTPGQCCVTECEVVLVVQNANRTRSRLFTCRHKLASLSECFNTLLHGNFREKGKKEVVIGGVVKKELVSFLSWAHQHPMPLQVTNVESLYNLIFLADRFLCPTLEKQIVAVLGRKSIFDTQDKPPQEEPDFLHRPLRAVVLPGFDPLSYDPLADLDVGEVGIGFNYHLPPIPFPIRGRVPIGPLALSEIGVDAKLKLLEVAEKHKGTEGCVLEACIRRCADLEIDQVAPFQGKVSDGTLAAVYATIGRAKDAKGFRRASIDISEINRIKIDKNLFRA